MSAFPDQPLHFLKWAQAKDKKIRESSFLPRKLYGEYLEDILECALAKLPSTVVYEGVDDEAISIKLIQDETKAVIKLASGNVVVAEKVVLATGNFSGALPHGVSESIASSERFIANPRQSDSTRL